MTGSDERLTVGHLLVALTVMTGTFMAVMDVSVVNVALPHMMGTFSSDLSAITWVATSYSIAEIIMATMAGWWSTVIGRKRLYMASIILFTVGSVLAANAHTFPQMIFYRVIQGIGGGALIPVGLAVLRETFPASHQGTAMAVYGMGVVLAPAFGPVLGGWLTDHYGWPWIFYINVPVSVLGIVLITLFIHDPPYLRRGVRRIDWGGIALLTIGLTGMQIVLERGQEENWFQSNWIVFGTIVTLAALLMLVIWELGVNDPVLNVRLLRNLPLSLGSSIGLVFGITLFGTTFLLPAFTQTLLGYPAFEAGLVLLPRALALFLCMPLAGIATRFVDPRLLVFFGVGFIWLSFHQLSRLSLDAGPGNFVSILIVMGIGMPFMFVTMTTVSLSTIAPQDTTDASSLYTLSRRVGGNIGYALVATLMARHSQIHRVPLTEHISDLSPQFVTQLQETTRHLLGRGLNPAQAETAAMAIIDRMVNTQATMLAFNDASWVMGMMFLVVTPLILFLPGRARTARERAGESPPPQTAGAGGTAPAQR
jgi:DHA2 family multidrug resistance protein